MTIMYEIKLSYFKILNMMYGLCSDCNKPQASYRWCQNCNSKRFQQDFDKWTSGNKYIDKLIQESQLKARNRYEAIEWIPYVRLMNVEYFAEGGFSMVYKAIWLDGYILDWNGITRKWNRCNLSQDSSLGMN